MTITRMSGISTNHYIIMITVSQYALKNVLLTKQVYEARHRDSRIVIPNDIIIGNLNKKQMIGPCLSTEVSSDRAAPGIAAAENEENL